MKIKIAIIFVMLLLFPKLLLGANPAEKIDADLTLIKQRLAEVLLSNDPAELAKLSQATNQLAALQADGSWTDVNYNDANIVTWQTARHLDRVLLMAKSYQNPKSAGFGDKKLLQGALLGLDGWLKRNPINPNWWWNENWLPQIMGSIMLLLEKDISAQQKSAMLTLMKRSVMTGKGGSNLTSAAIIQLGWGVLEPNEAAVTEAFAVLGKELSINSGIAEPMPFSAQVEGIQVDMTFYQHGRLLYSGGYGVGFIAEMARYIYLADGTRFAFPAEQRELVTALLLDGMQWMIRGRVFDYSAIGREISRAKQSDTALLKIAEACTFLAKIAAPRQAECILMLQRLTDDKADIDPIIGNKYFWRADFITHHRPDFYASVRMPSTRLRRSEMVNDENKKAFFISDGANYLIRHGEEYRNIFPVWDWTLIPGTTEQCVELPLKEYRPISLYGATNFVGGVSDGRSGLAAMDFARASMKFESWDMQDKGGLLARKSWFFFDQQLVCLASGITALTPVAPVRSSINQCFAKGEVLLQDDAGKRTLPTGEATLLNPQWIWHDGFAYYFPYPTTLHLRRDQQSGSWSEIGAGSAEKLSADIFKLWIDHGSEVKNGSCAYIIVPVDNVEQAEKFANDESLTIISNTPELQAVHNEKEELTMAAFYQPGQFTFNGGREISVDKPCLLMLRQNGRQCEITVSNPENQALKLDVSINLKLQGKDARPWRNRDGSTVEFNLPGGLYAGQSLTKKFNKFDRNLAEKSYSINTLIHDHFFHE